MILTKEFLDIAQDAVDDYIKATVPIFTVKFPEGKRKTSYVGSSFYVKYKENFFLITAYHVFLEAESFLVPSSNKRLETLQYDSMATIKDPNFDLIVLKLSENIKDTQFIPYELFESELDDNFLSPKLYIAFGFPATKVHFYNGMMNGHFELFYSEKENNEEYLRLNKNDNDHLLLQFDKNNVFVNGQKITACHPNGMSGGCVVSLHSTLLLPIRFEGILIEWDVEKKKTMIATRKQYVKYLLEQILTTNKSALIAKL